jgi:YVTN family beta-propeller protein
MKTMLSSIVLSLLLSAPVQAKKCPPPNPTTGNVQTFTIKEDGSLVIQQTTTAGSLPSASAVSPDNKLVVVANSGSNDITVFCLRDAILKQTQTIPAGRSPSDIAFSANGKFVYVVNKLSNTIDVYKVNGTTLVHIQTMTTSPNPTKLAVSPNDKIVAVATQGATPVAGAPKSLQIPAKKLGAFGKLGAKLQPKKAPFSNKVTKSLQQQQTENAALNIFPILSDGQCFGQLAVPQTIGLEFGTSLPSLLFPDQDTLAVAVTQQSNLGGEVDFYAVLADQTVSTSPTQTLHVTAEPRSLAFLPDGSAGIVDQVGQSTGIESSNGTYQITNPLDQPGQTPVERIFVTALNDTPCNPGDFETINTSFTPSISIVTRVCFRPDGTIVSSLSTAPLPFNPVSSMASSSPLARVGVLTYSI